MRILLFHCLSLCCAVCKGHGKTWKGRCRDAKAHIRMILNANEGTTVVMCILVGMAELKEGAAFGKHSFELFSLFPSDINI